MLFTVLSAKKSKGVDIDGEIHRDDDTIRKEEIEIHSSTTQAHREDIIFIELAPSVACGRLFRRSLEGDKMRDAPDKTAVKAHCFRMRFSSIVTIPDFKI